MILVVAKFDVAEEHRETFLAATRAVIERTRAEEGCLTYDLHEAVEHPGRFVFVEEYRDQAAVAAHAGSQHLKDFQEATGSMMSGAEIVAHEVSSSTKIA